MSYGEKHGVHGALLIVSIASLPLFDTGVFLAVEVLKSTSLTVIKMISRSIEE